MQQIALNLIAIGIFVITMSCLLGPLINLSPAIPASVTFAILGLATIDTLGWQGKGITLLLDSLARTSSEYRERVIRHEAGHFLVAYFLGIPITGYTLSAWETFRKGQPGLGGVSFDTQILEKKLNVPLERQLILDRFCTVWMAGIAAENLVYGNTEGGKDDFQKIQAALIFFGRPKQEFLSKQSWAKVQAKELLEKYWSGYEALVEAMKNKKSVNECCQLLQQHCQNEQLVNKD